MDTIKIIRTEQWEYTAIGIGFGQCATGSSEQSAELNLLRKILENKVTEIAKLARMFNHPAKASKKWVTYARSTVDLAMNTFDELLSEINSKS